MGSCSYQIPFCQLNQLSAIRIICIRLAYPFSVSPESDVRVHLDAVYRSAGATQIEHFNVANERDSCMANCRWLLSLVRTCAISITQAA